jgi:hypothetical protein
MTTYSRNIGSNRGKPRLWLEGAILASNGFSRGTPYQLEPIIGGFIIVRGEGARHVAGTADRPIIDISGGSYLPTMGQSVTIDPFSGGLIVLGVKP